MNDGKALEALVHDLLHTAGFRVQRETLIGHKKVDLYFEEVRLGLKVRTAVECKDLQSAMAKDMLTEIRADYDELTEKHLIDNVLVVSRNGLSAAAMAYVTDSRRMAHMTVAQLQRSIMDFSSYLQGLANQFSEDGLNSYYVPPQTVEDGDLGAQVMNWIDLEEHRPIAILASYGMGKTSFARRLAHVLATKALSDDTARTPILLRLGDIAAEQDLEGLLGKAFTASAAVRGYNFTTFATLNRSGCFVIILDGFDEMKHTLSWEQFRYNFAQLNRLVVERSKVVLLGRPNAFLNETEYNHVLHGLVPVAGREVRDPEWPDFRELHIAPFSRSQVEQFLRYYTAFRAKQEGLKQPQLHDSRDHEELIHAVSNKHFADIARRPVQLKMLAEVLPHWQGDITSITISGLYDFFIDRVIDRDASLKPSRQVFGLVERRQFATDLAWHMWRNCPGMSILVSEIPAAIWEQYCTDKAKLEGTQRDLVAACFLSRKPGGALYFPHRSFQEFLVAEEILSQLATGSLSYTEASEICTDEVAFFMQSMVGTKDLVRMGVSLAEHRGGLPWRIAQLWMGNPDRAADLLKNFKETSVAWYPLLYAAGVGTRKLPADRTHEFSSIAAEKWKGDSPPQYLLLLHFCELVLASPKPGSGDRSMLAHAISELINVESRRLRRRPGPAHRSEEVIPAFEREARKLFEERTKMVRGYAECFEISKRGTRLDLRGNLHYLGKLLRNYCMISEWILGDTLKPQGVNLPDYVEVDQSLLNLLKEFRGDTSPAE